DLRRGPLAAVRHQNPETEVAGFQPPVLLQVGPEAHLDAALLTADHLPTDQGADILTAADLGDLPLDRFRCAAGMESHFLELVAHPGHVLMQSAELSRIKLRAEHHHHVAFLARNAPPTPQSAHRGSAGQSYFA